MSYYWFNRKEILQKAKKKEKRRYSKEKAETYLQKQRSNKRKVKGLIQKLVKKRKRQD